MSIKLKEIEYGHATIEDLACWINERHSIFVNRFEKELPKPWTDDKIFQQYKFTNAFRQLDKGTLALRNMLIGIKLPAFSIEQEANSLLFFNVVWYRLFNLNIHAEELGFVTDFKDLEEYIQKCFRTHKKIFTSAHMMGSVAFEDKYITYLRAAKNAWDWKKHYNQWAINFKSIEQTFNELLSLYMVGRFVAYEITCDLRFTKLLENATDKLTWANMGPGAQRGLRRLGMPHKNQTKGLESMQWLYKELPKYLDAQVLQHIYKGQNYIDPPFELQEVEHSLCEFDKYQRVKLGQGMPRSRYDGVG